MGDTRREQLASLPFAEKLKILEKLRARSLEIAAAGLRGTQSQDKDNEENKPPSTPDKNSRDLP